MTSALEPEFDFSRYRYYLHHVHHEIEKADTPTSADEIATTLLKDAKQLPEKMNPKKLYEISKLTDSLIGALPDPDKDRFFTLFRSRVPRDHLIILKKQLVSRLAAIEERHITKINTLLESRDVDHYKIKSRLQKASKTLLEHESFRKAKKLFIAHFCKECLKKSADELTLQIPDILGMDQELAWLQAYAEMELATEQIQILIQAIADLQTQQFISDPKMKNRLLLFNSIYDCLRENGSAAQDSLQGACQLLEIIRTHSGWTELFARFDTRISICLLKELARMVAKDGCYNEVLKKGITVFIEKNPALLARFKQLQGVPSEKSMLTDVDILEIAYFIETTFNASCNFMHGHFKKGIHPVPASLQRDSETGDVYVLLSRKKITFFESHPGSKKLPRATIRLAHHPYEKAEFFCQTVNPTWIQQEGKATKRLTDESIRSQLIKEATLQQSFRGVRGIWPLFTYCEYTKMVGSKEASKVSIISPLGKLIKEAVDFDLKTKLSLMLDLAYGLSHLHANKYVHGDVKPGNALIGKDENGNFFAGLIDYGFTESVRLGDQQTHIAHGLYGTRHYTAPELFGERHKKLDYYKLDVWALGNLYYLLITHNDPPWKNDVFCDKTKKNPSQIQSSLNENVSHNIEKPLEHMLQKKKLTLEDQCQQLVYNTLRLVPEQRWNIDQVVYELKRILLAT